MFFRLNKKLLQKLCINSFFSGIIFFPDFVFSNADGFQNELRDWVPTGATVWSFNDNEVAGRKGDGFLSSRKSFREFRLSVDFWVSADTNSGIFIHIKVT